MFKIQKMKNLQIIISITVFIFLSCQINAQLQVRNDAFIQIGYEDYRTLSFGVESSLPNNGKFAIEHVNTKSGVGGLNFWKPWPTPNYGNYMLWLRDDKNVAIGGYGSSFYKLMVYGSAYSLGSWIGSDRKLKSNIQPLHSGIEQILKLKPKSYIYDFSLEKYSTTSTQDVESDEIKKNTIEGDQFITYKSGRMLGFIADELGQVFPQLVQKDEEGFEAINYDGLIPVLVSAIQEQHERIVALENALNSKKEPTIKNKPSNKIENTNQQFSRLLYNSPLKPP